MYNVQHVLCGADAIHTGLICTMCSMSCVERSYACCIKVYNVQHVLCGAEAIPTGLKCTMCSMYCVERKLYLLD